MQDDKENIISDKEDTSSPPEDDAVNKKTNQRKNNKDCNHRNIGCDPGEFPYPEGEIRPEHNQLTVAKINDFHNPKDEVKTHSGNTIDPTQKNAVYENLQKIFHRNQSLLFRVS